MFAVTVWLTDAEAAEAEILYTGADPTGLSTAVGPTELVCAVRITHTEARWRAVMLLGTFAAGTAAAIVTAFATETLGCADALPAEAELPDRTGGFTAGPGVLIEAITGYALVVGAAISIVAASQVLPCKPALPAQDALESVAGSFTGCAERDHVRF